LGRVGFASQLCGHPRTFQQRLRRRQVFVLLQARHLFLNNFTQGVILGNRVGRFDGTRWGALASLLSFAVIRALSSSDYVAARYSFCFKPGIYF
jgi:hypothetical protein